MTIRICWFKRAVAPEGLGARGALAALALVMALGAPGESAAQDDCARLERAPDDIVIELATGCRLHREREWGPDDPRLLDLYKHLGDRVGSIHYRSIAALPLRERAMDLARRLYGENSLEAGEATLAYVRNWILSERCEVVNPTVGELLRSARVALDPDDDKKRRARNLRGVANAFGDALFVGEAADTLLDSGIELNAGDWERIAHWRGMQADEEGVEAALRAGLALNPPQPQNARIVERLRRILFERGDFAGLEELKEQ